jgi:ribose transport system substrate-binding protein
LSPFRNETTQKKVDAMKRMSHVLFLATIVAVAISTASCSKTPQGTASPDSPEAGEVKGKIGMTCMDLTNPFFKLIANVMQEEAAKYGYELVALSGDQDPAKQNNQLSDFVAQGYDAIFLNPVDSKSAGEGVKKAHEAGVPVFTFDVQVTDEEAKDMVLFHIGSDNFQGGKLAAESMMEVTGDRGKIAIITLPEITSCIYRYDGFMAHLKEKDSKLEVVTELSGKGNRTGGFAVASDILQAHPGIVGIFAVNDPSGLGAHAAVVDAEKQDQITIIAFDASPAGKQAVFEKALYDSPQQFPRKMAIGTVEAFIKYLDGEDLEKRVFIPCEHYRHEEAVADETRTAEQW